MPGEKLPDDAKAIEIGRDGCGHYQRFLAAGERKGFTGRRNRRQNPSGKKVCYGTHGELTKLTTDCLMKEFISAATGCDRGEILLLIFRSLFAKLLRSK